MASKQFNAIDGYTVGNSTIISVIDANGNVSGNVITATANVTAPRFISNVTTGTAPLTVTSTTQVANLNVATAGTVTTAAQPNITSVGTLTSLVVTGNASVGVLLVSNASPALPTGTGSNPIMVGGIGTPNIGALYIGDGTGWNFKFKTRASSTDTDRVTFFDNGNVTLNTGVITGNGSGLSAIAGANVTGTVTSATAATTAGTVTTAAQPNITSVGTLSTATITTGNITTINSGLLQNGNSNVTITANANVTINAVGGARITATSTGANITGTLGVSGNANVGNLGTAQVLATANITAPQLISNIATGTAPFVVTSTTQVANLSVATAGTATTAGTVTTAAQPNITSVGTLSTATITTATITTGNITTINSGLLQNGNSNVTITANGNINTSVSGTLMHLTDTVGLRPGSDNVYDLGASAARWRQGYFGNSVVTPRLSGGAGFAFINLVGAEMTFDLGGITNNNDGYNFANRAYTITSGIGRWIRSTMSFAPTSGTAEFRHLSLEPTLNQTGGANGSMTVYHANVVQTAVVGSPYFAKWQVSSVDKWSVGTDGTMLVYNNSDATNTNYDRAFFRHSGNVLQIGQEAGGTGTGRTIMISTPANGITLKSGANAQLNLASGGVRMGSAYSIGWSSVAQADGGSWDTYFDRASAAKVKLNDGAGSLWTGSIQLGNADKTANYTLTNFDTYIAANATASFTLTLPTAVGIGGQSFTINKVNATNTVTVATTSSQTINGASTHVLSQQWDTVTVVSDGVNWIITNNATFATTAGTVTTAAQPNITSVGTLTGLGVNGNITAANITANTGVFTGNGSGLSAIAGANVTGTVSSATTAGTVTTAAQPNITSVGTLTTATITTGNITTINSGLLQNGNSNVTITANANVTINAVGGARITATSTGANITGTLGVSGNANVGNLGTAQVLATANITTPQIIANIAQGTAPFLVNSNTVVANLNASLLLGATSATANTASTIALRDANGNVSANFFIGNGSQLTGIVASAGASIANGNSNVNIPAANGNVNISAVGNANVLVVTGTGVNVAGTLNATGNANVGNLGTARVIATGNISGTQLISNITTGTAPFVVTSTTQVANLSVATAGTATSATTAGTVTTAAQPNITSVGTLTSLAVTGNITAGNLLGIFANGNSNVRIPAANGNVNISAVGNANIVVVTGTGVFVTPKSGPGLTVYAVSGTHSTTIADSGNTTYSAGYLEIPQSGAAAKTANYTAVLADSGKSIIMNGSSLFATIPANASVAFNIGTTLTFINLNASNLTLSITTDTLRLAGSSSTGNRILTQYGLATAVKVTTTSWIVGGTGLT